MNKMIKLKDDWRVFNPKSYDWFPTSFECKNDIFEEEHYLLDNYEEECTDEDGWDAMMDGKYGDYPGIEWAPEAWGFKNLSFHKPCGNKTIAGYEENS